MREDWGFYCRALTKHHRAPGSIPSNTKTWFMTMPVILAGVGRRIRNVRSAALFETNPG